MKLKNDLNYSLRGEANTHKIRFHVNSNRNILVEPVSALNYQNARAKAKGIAYKWLDIKNVNKSIRCITVVDDRDQKWETVWNDDEARNAIVTYSDVVIRWEVEQPKLINLLIG